MTETIYKMALGWDVAEGSMAAIVVQQPQVDIVGPVVRSYGGGGAIWEQGLFTCYHFSMVESETEWLTILTQFALNSEDTSEVTILAKNNRLSLVRWNAVAQVPEGNQDIKWSNFFPRDMAIYFVDLEEAA